MRILIKNGKVIDGSGKPAYRADVLTDNGLIADIGLIDVPADRVFDAEGLYVTPAFVDIHRHYDAKPLMGSEMRIELRQGIATAACGVCGFSLAPGKGEHAEAKRAYDAPILGAYPADFRYTFPEYMDALEKSKPGINTAALIGLGAVRIAVNGMSDRHMNAAQLDSAAGMIGEALGAGAAGVSAGIMYLPEFYTAPDEYDVMLKPLRGTGKPLVTHIRGEGNSMVDSVREVISIAERAECPLHISHFKSCGKANWNREIFRAIDVIENARAKGKDVTADFYPYSGGSTSLTTMVPPVYVRGDMDAALERMGTLEGVDEYRCACAVLYPDWDNYAVMLGWDRIIVSGVVLEENKKYLGKDIVSAAAEYGFDSPEALAAHLMHSEHGATAIINLSMAESDVDAVAMTDWTNVISDSIYADTDTPHPRMFGAFPRFLRRYAIDGNMMSIERAIRKMTSQPAARLGLKGRGVIENGAHADIAVFSPDEIYGPASYEKPNVLSRGIRLLTVNGEVRVENDELTGTGSGTVIRI